MREQETSECHHVCVCCFEGPRQRRISPRPSSGRSTGPTGWWWTSRTTTTAASSACHRSGSHRKWLLLFICLVGAGGGGSWVHLSSPNESTCLLWMWRRGSKSTRSGARVWFASLAVSQTCSQSMLDSGSAALSRQFCLLFSWTEFVGAARGRKGVQFGNRMHLGFLQIMWSSSSQDLPG